LAIMSVLSVKDCKKLKFGLGTLFTLSS